MDEDSKRLEFLEARYQEAEADWIAAHCRLERALFALAAFLNDEDVLPSSQEENPGIH
jgi:hypothetical protein